VECVTESDFRRIDEETKAGILKLHDPADNLKNLDPKDVRELKRENPAYSHDDEASKLLRIFLHNCIEICPHSDLHSNTDEAGLYNNISLINHSCNPNVIWTWVRGDMKRREIRAMKVIEKDEELLACYHAEYYGSRETRQKTMLKSHGFLCVCSECLLEGEELMDNERIRAKLRKKIKITVSLIFGRVPISSCPHNVKRAVKLSQELMVLVKKLNLQPQIVDLLLLPGLLVAWNARNMGLSGPDPISIKQEALAFCQKFGDIKMYEYNDISKKYP